jgi:hypothetical protein
MGDDSKDTEYSRMTQFGNPRPDVESALKGLKDFQQDTVEYVFGRLYTDPDPVSRFLIADEVGLGKTMVARGVIAKAVDHLWESAEHINVVYICSNQAIARQNIDRLNITKDHHFQYASRSTLLPINARESPQFRLDDAGNVPRLAVADGALGRAGLALLPPGEPLEGLARPTGERSSRECEVGSMVCLSEMVC